MVLDYKRHCHYSYMKLWQGSDVLTYGRWFRATPTAKILEGPSAFRSRVTWNRGETITGVGEVADKETPYYKGQNELHYPGRRYCGPEAAIREGGIVGVTPGIATDAKGDSTCCSNPPPIIGPTSRTSFRSAGVMTFAITMDTGYPWTGHLYLYRVGALACIPPNIPGWQLTHSMPWAAPVSALQVYRQVFTVQPSPLYQIPDDGMTAQFGTIIFYPGTTVKVGPTDAGTFPAAISGLNRYHMRSITPAWPGSALVDIWIYPTGAVRNGGTFPAGVTGNGHGGWSWQLGFNTPYPATPTPDYWEEYSGVTDPVRYWTNATSPD